MTCCGKHVSVWFGEPYHVKTSEKVRWRDFSSSFFFSNQQSDAGLHHFPPRLFSIRRWSPTLSGPPSPTWRRGALSWHTCCSACLAAATQLLSGSRKAWELWLQDQQSSISNKKVSDCSFAPEVFGKWPSSKDCWPLSCSTAGYFISCGSSLTKKRKKKGFWWDKTLKMMRGNCEIIR